MFSLYCRERTLKIFRSIGTTATLAGLGFLTTASYGELTVDLQVFEDGTAFQRLEKNTPSYSGGSDSVGVYDTQFTGGWAIFEFNLSGIPEHLTIADASLHLRTSFATSNGNNGGPVDSVPISFFASQGEGGIDINEFSDINTSDNLIASTNLINISANTDLVVPFASETLSLLNTLKLENSYLLVTAAAQRFYVSATFYSLESTLPDARPAFLRLELVPEPSSAILAICGTVLLRSSRPSSANSARTD